MEGAGVVGWVGDAGMESMGDLEESSNKVAKEGERWRLGSR